MQLWILRPRLEVLEREAHPLTPPFDKTMGVLARAESEAEARHVESAAVPLPALSAWQGLFDHGGLEPNERVLVHGAVGGVGQFATQLARWRGAYVVATVSPQAFEGARALGAHEVMDGRKELEDALGPDEFRPARQSYR